MVVFLAVLHSDSSLLVFLC